MFWFWFHLVVDLVTVALDAAWWAVALRLTKKKVWRGLVSVFMAGQMAAVLSLRCGFDWRAYVPNFVPLAVITWHYFLLALGFVVLVPAGTVWACRWIARAVRRSTIRRDGSSGSDPATTTVPAAASARSLRRREFLGAAAALVPPLLTVGLTGFALARLDKLRVRRFTLSIPSLPRELDGMTIAQVSDLHLGGFTSAQVLREMASATNALRADLVVMTGDLINYELADLAEGIGLIKAMEGRYGLWMIEGNHDLFENGAEFERRVKAAGVSLLVDESAVTKVRGYPVQCFGLSWTGSDVGGTGQRDRMTAMQLRDVMKQRHPDAFPILLAHHPHAFDAAIQAGLPLTLAGHTHGGFWMLDRAHGVGPTVFRYWSGLYRRGNSQLIVSNGVGNWSSLPPIRVNAPAEIVHLTLRCAGTSG